MPAFHFGRSLARADPQGAGEVGGAIGVLPARIDQIDAAGFKPPVGFLGNAVVDDGAVGAAARNGVEGEVYQLAGVGAVLVEGFGGGDFGELALGGLTREPVEEAGDGGAIAGLRGAVAGLFNRVLAGLG